jgi:hypothetical protein
LCKIRGLTGHKRKPVEEIAEEFGQVRGASGIAKMTLIAEGTDSQGSIPVESHFAFHPVILF